MGIPFKRNWCGWMSRAFVCCFGWKLPLKSNSDFATSLPQRKTGGSLPGIKFQVFFSVSFGGGEITITFLKRHPCEPRTWRILLPGLGPVVRITPIYSRHGVRPCGRGPTTRTYKSWDDPPSMDQWEKQQTLTWFHVLKIPVRSKSYLWKEGSQRLWNLGDAKKKAGNPGWFRFKKSVGNPRV